MDNQQAYNTWANQYDTNNNKTRDLEAMALRTVLDGQTFGDILEVGCGTGKNTDWYQHRCNSLLGLDFSEEMLVKAQSKITTPHIRFQWADITQPWDVPEQAFDLVSFSLVLEHIENLDHIFREVARVLRPSGRCYVGEFHPFKQYMGSKARFEQENGDTFLLECYTHHTSEYYNAAKKHGLTCIDLREWADSEGEHAGVPRVLSMVFG